MGIVNNQSVFIGPPLGEGEGITITSFRDDDDFSIDLFDESIILPSFPNNVGIAFVRSSDSPADYATLTLQGTDTSTLYVDNTAGAASFAVSNDVYVGYKATNVGISSTGIAGNLYVNGFIYGGFTDLTLGGRTRFGFNTIEIDGDNNTITGVTTFSANVGVITAISGISSIGGNNFTISGITTITPTTNLNVNGGLVVSGVSTVGIASTSRLTSNSTLSFELTSNTNLRIRVRGTDGVIRSANLTLS
jgi:hypothetical protein